MPTDPKTIERINALIARATDTGTSEEERRTSAVIACSLIKSSGLQLVDRTGLPHMDQEQTVSGGSSEGVSWVNIGLDRETEEMLSKIASQGLNKVMDAWFQRAAKEASRPAKPERVYAPKEGQGRAGNQGICMDCKKVYKRGDHIRFRSDLGAMIHYMCDWPDDYKPADEHAGQDKKKPT